MSEFNRMPCHITDGPDYDDDATAHQFPEDDEDVGMLLPHDDLVDAMDRLRLSVRDVAMLTGKHRRTVWRWRTGRTAVPVYVWTIIKDRQKIRELTLELCK